MIRRLCSIDGCTKKHYGLGFCRQHHHKATYKKSPSTEARKEYDRAYSKKNHLKVRKKNKKYRSKNKETLTKYNREYQLNRYGITETQFNEMFECQQGLCAICFQPETSMVYGKVRQLSVDHDHSTGKVRGLLCTKCNQAIGLLNDNPDRCKGAGNYLEKYNGHS